MKRAFIVYPPTDNSIPAPVWVPLSGTVKSARHLFPDAPGLYSCHVGVFNDHYPQAAATGRSG